MSVSRHYSSNSPAVKSDFSNFMKSDPDLTEIVEWIKDNLDPEETIELGNDPEIWFSTEAMETWAKKHGWHEYISDFPQEKLDDWAKNNDYVKSPRESTYENVMDLLQQSFGEMSLSWDGDYWGILRHGNNEYEFSGETMEELDEEVGGFFAERERIRKEINERKTNTVGKRGRPKGSKNKSK